VCEAIPARRVMPRDIDLSTIETVRFCESRPPQLAASFIFRFVALNLDTSLADITLPAFEGAGHGNTQRRRAIIFRSGGVVRSVNRFTLATWPLWYFLGMRGLTILFVTFAALLVMRGQQQPHFALRPTAPMPAVNVP